MSGISLSDAQREVLADALRDTSAVGCREIVDDALAPVIEQMICEAIAEEGQFLAAIHRSDARRSACDRLDAWAWASIDEWVVCEPQQWTDLPNGRTVWNGGQSARMVRAQRNYVILPPREFEWRIA